MKKQRFMHAGIIVVVCLLFVGMVKKNEPPEWLRGAVWYQILPERFRNINPANDPVRDGIVARKVDDWQVHPWASDWYKLQVWEQERKVPFSQLLADRRYGGDLIGVTEKLPYLKGLGVNVIYLTPIFDSPSIEKYDATTFHHIDNNFGLARKEDLEKIKTENEDTSKWTMTKADEVFAELVHQAHELEMKVVIEAAFSFCSDQFWAFRDVKKNQQNSKYKEWFEVLSWDDPQTPDTVEFDYKCQAGDKRRPTFRLDSRGGLVDPVKKYVFECTKRWMDPNNDGKTLDGIDGWSINFVSELSAQFWQEWNDTVKAKNANAITISDYPLQNEEKEAAYGFDMTIDSALATLIKDFFVPGGKVMSVSEFVSRLKDLRKNETDEMRDMRIIQLDSHRTFRFASLIVNGYEVQPDDQHAGNGHSQYNPVAPDSTQRKLQKLLALFQLTYPGAPMIYYGDESGMWGGKYPDNIKPMLWHEFVYEKESYETIRPDLTIRCENRFDRTIFDLYRKMNLVRAKNEALIKGDFETHIVDDERRLLAYSRKHKTNEVYVFMNLSQKPQQVSHNPEWRKNQKVEDPFSDSKYKVDKYEIKLELPPLSARVLVKEK